MIAQIPIDWSQWGLVGACVGSMAALTAWLIVKAIPSITDRYMTAIKETRAEFSVALSLQRSDFIQALKSQRDDLIREFESAVEHAITRAVHNVEKDWKR
jgi:hypothetical protein